MKREQYAEFFKALGKLRHDDDFTTMKEEAKKYFKTGASSGFALDTVAQIYQAMQEVHEEKEESKRKVLDSFKNLG